MQTAMSSAPPQAYTLLEFVTQLFDAINRKDLDGLRQWVDDDFGIVDVDPQGNTIIIRDQAGWDAYMQENFGLMQQMQAQLDSQILDYHEYVQGSLGYSVVEFRQHVRVGEQSVSHRCIATVIWRWSDNQWKEVRWHCSRLGA